jgi:hypothetical protein
MRQEKSLEEDAGPEYVLVISKRSEKSKVLSRDKISPFGRYDNLLYSMKRALHMDTCHQHNLFSDALFELSN